VLAGTAGQGHPQPRVQHHRRRFHLWSGRRVVEAAGARSEIPENHKDRHRPVQRRRTEAILEPVEYRADEIIAPYASSKK